MSLTPLQRDAAGVIAEFRAFYGRPPTYRELQRELDAASVATAYRAVRGLEGRGWLQRVYTDRGLSLMLLHTPPPPDERAVELTAAGRAWLQSIGAAS